MLVTVNCLESCNNVNKPKKSISFLVQIKNNNAEGSKKRIIKYQDDAFIGG
jgi:hypothetical protein